MTKIDLIANEIRSHRFYSHITKLFYIDETHHIVFDEIQTEALKAVENGLSIQDSVDLVMTKRFND